MAQQQKIPSTVLDIMVRAGETHQASCGECDAHVMCERGVGYILGVLDASRATLPYGTVTQLVNVQQAA